ncbi:VPLPA-CTERM-specific exosortase XrtD [Microbulbifer mangrovi]|uniref:VPLPA-CTERM-specific exosortase XrtD n=1 Tax=Microbulbifer mangrovi TaxID=927787 RepID=UPI00117C0669|nr:VPLPA-CTERM-specific exosortase XrtD [Microbulbifer mangrovi]
MSKWVSRENFARVDFQWMLVVLAAIFALAAFGGGLADLFKIWADREEYSHGIFIPILSVALLWRRRYVIINSVGNSSIIGFFIVTASLLMLVIGELGSVEILVQIGFIFFLSGLVMLVGGASLLRCCAAPVLFLLFAIPLPNFIDSQLSWGLQLLSSRLGVDMLRMAGVSVHLQGNLIDLGYYKLQVVEACSGLRYLYPLLSLGAIAAYLYLAPLWKKLLILISVIPIVVLMNSFRIAVIGLLVSIWGSNMADGFLHFFEGWIVFMVCVLLLLLEVWLLDRWGKARSLRELLAVPEFTAIQEERSAVSINRKLLSVTVMLAICIVLVFRFEERRMLIPERATFSEFPMDLGDWSGSAYSLEQGIENLLAADDYLIADFSATAGDYVNLYMAYYVSQNEGRSVHSPRLCIPGGGWKITDFKTVSYALADGSDFPINRAEIELNSEKQLVYYWFEQRGRRVANEYLMKWYLLVDSIKLNRTDGALVRVTTVVGHDEDVADADARIATFISDAISHVQNYVPKQGGQWINEDTI